MPIDTPQLTGTIVLDAHPTVRIREDGVRAIYTCDGDFNRVALIDVLDLSTGQRGNSSLPAGRQFR